MEPSPTTSTVIPERLPLPHQMKPTDYCSTSHTVALARTPSIGWQIQKDILPQSQNEFARDAQGLLMLGRRQANLLAFMDLANQVINGKAPTRTILVAIEPTIHVLQFFACHGLPEES
jgi:hypothetical protein